MATAGIKNRDGRKPELTTLRLNEGCSKYALLALSAMQCTLYSDNGKISGARLKNDLFRYQFLWRKKAVTRYMFPHWICQVLNLLTLKAAKGWKGICAPPPSHCADVESLGGLDHTEAAITSAILHNLFEMFPKAVIPGITFPHQGREWCRLWVEWMIRLRGSSHPSSFRLTRLIRLF